MSDDKQLVRKVYAGDVITPVGNAVVSLKVDTGSVDAAMDELRRALTQLQAQMLAAVRVVAYPNEQHIIDQE